MTTRAIHRFLTLALVVVLSGCVYSTPPVVTWGQKYSKDALAFLKLPDMAREEVIATLGPPNYDLRTSRTIVYVWATSYDLKMLHPDHIGKLDIGSEPVHLGSVDTQWGLFVVFNESNAVVSHSISEVDKSTMDELSGAHDPPTKLAQ